MAVTQTISFAGQRQGTRGGGSKGAPPLVSLLFGGTKRLNAVVPVAAVVMAAMSGLAGLAHQILWTRRLVDLLGASPLTFSKVVGAFFIGLAAGSALAALRSGPSRRPWLWVALVESCIALLALPALFTPQVATWLHQSAQLTWLKHIVPFLFVTPPAIAMGFAVPWMIRALSERNPIKNTAIWLYTANTFGGVIGIIAVLLFVLPLFGLTRAALIVCAVNVLAAGVALLLDRINCWTQRRHPTDAASLNPVGNNQSQGIAFVGMKPARTTCVLAFLSGFLVLAMEVVLQHQFAQVSINSLFSSATVLVWVLLSLAAGSALVPFLSKLARNTSALTRCVLVCAGVLCAAQPFVFTWLRDGVAILPYELTPDAYTFEVSKLGLMALCPAFIAAGVLFPLLLQQASAASSSVSARNIAVLLAWNGLGGWIGSELAQDVIVPQAGLWQSTVLVGLGYCAVAAFVRGTATDVVTPPRRPQLNILRWLPLPACFLILVALRGAATLPQVTVNGNERLAIVEVGREGIVATVECGPGDWRMLFNNSYTLGGSKAQSNQERQAHLPILLHGDAKSVGVLGVATGSTVAGAALHPFVERIDAAELSPLVLKQAETFFAPYNRNVFADPRVRFMAEDARWMVASQHEAYDVVIGDLFLPWRTGEGRLFSVEHFQSVRRSLKPDGVFCQWLPLFQLTRPQFDAIARTFQQVFPEVLVVRGDFYTELPILGLVGGRELSQINWQRVTERCAELREAGVVTDPLSRHEDGVAMMIVGMLPALDGGPVNTLGNAWLEWNCGKNILGMKTPWFIGVPEAEFVRDIQRATNPLLPETLQSAHDSGQFFLTLEIAAKLRLAVFSDLHGQVTKRLPEALRHDAAAQWQEWPSRVKPRPVLETARAN